MDINIFSPKSQTLTLATCTPLLSWLNPSDLRSIRREFLRPPATTTTTTTTTRWKRKKLGLLLHTRSPQFLVKASLNSDPETVLLIAALATFTAVSVAYFLKNLTKTSKDKEVSGSADNTLPQLHNNLADNTIDNQIVDPWDLSMRTTCTENENEYEYGSHQVFEETNLETESNQVSKEKNAQQTILVKDGSPLTETSTAYGDDSLAFSSSGDVSLKESESTSLPCPSYMLSESCSLQPIMFVTEITELQLEKGQTKNQSEIEISIPTLNVDSGASLPIENDVHIQVNGQTGLPCMLIEESESAISYSSLAEPVTEEQCTYNGANLTVLKSPANLDAVKAISSHASPLNTYSLFSQKRDNPEIKGTELSIRQMLQTAEYVEGEIPHASQQGGPFHKTEDIKQGRGPPRNKERRHLMQGNGKNVIHVSYPNRMGANDTDYLSGKFRTYNHLLRQGRLTDCIDLLEDLESKGLLDMNQVYHARFFNTCKSQKAIKDAFRFFKLVPNPNLSTFNMLMSVCASSQDSEGAFQVLRFVQEVGFKADCKLYTTLITTCAKSGKVDAMFEVFHEMVNAGVEPNVHTYGALIDGCAKAGQVAKAFGAYGIMRSKNVKPDRVVFNALITACGQSGAVDRAFDVLAEMNAETPPIDPDHVTIGALMKACSSAGQLDRARQVYKMIHKYNIKGTPEVYTIAVNFCSQIGDWDFACSVYGDMTRKGVIPDEVFLSALVDVAGHTGKVGAAFEILQEAKTQGIRIGIISYSSLMGACSNAKNWQKALELYENMKSIKLKPTVSTMNALITALCDGDQLPKAVEVLSEMKRLGLCPNTITYSILSVASERKDDIEVGLMLLLQAKEDEVTPSLIMFKCIIGMCLRRFEKAHTLGERVSSVNSGRPQIENKWTSVALMVYREAIAAGIAPTIEVVSQVLGCLQLPYDAEIRDRLVENLGVSANSSRRSNLCSLIDGFGEYDPRAFSLLEEAASLGIVPCASFIESPVVVDAKKLEIHTAKVYLLTILKGLKHRLAGGAKLPNVTILLPVEKTQITSEGGEKTINVAERTSQAVAASLRRLRLPYQGNESYGKIRINGLALKRWFQPKLATPFSGKPGELGSLQLGKGITHQQRNIRTGNLSLD